MRQNSATTRCLILRYSIYLSACVLVYVMSSASVLAQSAESIFFNTGITKVDKSRDSENQVPQSKLGDVGCTGSIFGNVENLTKVSLVECCCSSASGAMCCGYTGNCEAGFIPGCSCN